MGVLGGSAVRRRLRALAQHVSSGSGAAASAAAAAAAGAAPESDGHAGAAGGAGKKGLKVYISVDIEGAVGIAHWDEADSGHSDYGEFQDRMTQEAVRLQLAIAGQLFG